MKKHAKVAALIISAMIPATAAVAQTSVVTDPAVGGTTTVSPEMVQQAAPASSVPVQSSDQFLQSVADKFGTSVSYLKELLGKLPPAGPGLSSIEVWGISSKLKLNAEEKAIFKAKAGRGGTGFTAADIEGMGARLGMTPMDSARLAQELGLIRTTVAGPTTPVQPGMTDVQIQQSGVIQRQVVPSHF